MRILEMTKFLKTVTRKSQLSPALQDGAVILRTILKKKRTSKKQSLESNAAVMAHLLDKTSNTEKNEAFQKMAEMFKE